jgi:hypothetical protein
MQSLTSSGTSERFPPPSTIAPQDPRLVTVLSPERSGCSEYWGNSGATRPSSPVPGTRRAQRYLKALTARATTSPKTASATVACTSITYFARRLSGITSVGLNAVAFVKPRCR